MTPSQLSNCASLWRQGKTTWEIAKALSTPKVDVKESEIANVSHIIRKYEPDWDKAVGE